jgi:hypothetical protein
VDILRDDAVCYAQGLQDSGVEVHQTTYKVCMILDISIEPISGWLKIKEKSIVPILSDRNIMQSLPHIFWVYAQHLEVSKKAQKDCVHGLRWLLGITDIHQPDF